MSFSAIDPENATPTSCESELLITQSVNDTSFRDGEMAYSRLTKTFFALLTTALVANGTTVLATQSQSTTRKWVALNITPSAVTIGGSIYAPDQWTTPNTSLAEIDASTLPVGTQAILPYKSPWVLVPGTTANTIFDPDVIPASNAAGKIWVRRKELGAEEYLKDADFRVIFVDTVNGDDDADGVNTPLFTIDEALQRLVVTGSVLTVISVSGDVLLDENPDCSHVRYQGTAVGGITLTTPQLFVVGTPTNGDGVTLDGPSTGIDPTTNTQLIVQASTATWSRGQMLLLSIPAGDFYGYVGCNLDDLGIGPGFRMSVPCDGSVFGLQQPGETDVLTPVTLPAWTPAIKTKNASMDVFFMFFRFDFDTSILCPFQADSARTWYTFCQFANFGQACENSYAIGLPPTLELLAYPFAYNPSQNGFGTANVCSFECEPAGSLFFGEAGPWFMAFGVNALYNSTFVCPAFDPNAPLAPLVGIGTGTWFMGGLYGESVGMMVYATDPGPNTTVAHGTGFSGDNGFFDVVNQGFGGWPAFSVTGGAVVMVGSNLYGQGNDIGCSVTEGGILRVDLNVASDTRMTITGVNQELQFVDLSGGAYAAPSTWAGGTVPAFLTNLAFWSDLYAPPFNGLVQDYSTASGTQIQIGG